MENQDFNAASESAFGVETVQDSQQGFENFESVNDNVSHNVPLAALIEERKKFQKQIEEEKSLRHQYEDVLRALGQDGNTQSNPTDLIRAEYESIFNARGEAAANMWLSQQMNGQNFAVQAENQSVLQEVQDKYKDMYAVPEVKQAIDAYLQLDMDPGSSLKEQGFPEAVEYISSIYKAGYEAAFSLKFQNDMAKSRMGSSINSGMPSSSSGRAFTRADIRAMDPETFSQHEKSIFDQMAKGLIK